MSNANKASKERLVVFIAPYPRLSDEKDGFIQRVASIDLLVQKRNRVYLDISVRRFWSARVHSFEGVQVFQVNAIRHFLLIANWLRKASVIYVHSIYCAFPALIAYWLGKPITDLHGVVPEELLLQGKWWKSRLFNIVERIVVKRSSIVIYVTETMRLHFAKKYERRMSCDRVIAIMPQLSDSRGSQGNVLEHSRELNSVIYVGGLQAWQNIPLMLSSATAANHLNFIFLTNSVDEFRKLAERKNIKNFVCSTASSLELPDYYLKSTFGFILRDPILVNEVACPTKLIEYLYWGVIPIVLTPEIGDFQRLGFAFILLEDFNAGVLPDANEISRMRAINRQVVEDLLEKSIQEKNKLNEILCNA